MSTILEIQAFLISLLETYENQWRNASWQVIRRIKHIHKVTKPYENDNRQQKTGNIESDLMSTVMFNIALEKIVRKSE